MQRTAPDNSCNRRAFLKRLLTGAVVVSPVAVPLEVRWEVRRLQVTRHRVALRGLPSAFTGFRVVQLTDLHLGPVVAPELLERAVEKTNRLRPDLVCLTGDFISATARNAEPCAGILSGLQAGHGCLAVLGNHDHWADADRVSNSLRSHGIRVLRNDVHLLRRDGASLTVAGMDDVWAKAADLNKTLVKAGFRRPLLLLVHEPDVADEVCRYPVDLQLSGHSHGGQVRLPGFGAPLLPRFGRKYPRGWYRVGDLRLYTNRGVGLIRPPIRFFCPSEIALFELHPAWSRATA